LENGFAAAILFAVPQEGLPSVAAVFAAKSLSTVVAAEWIGGGGSNCSLVSCRRDHGHVETA